MSVLIVVSESTIPQQSDRSSSTHRLATEDLRRGLPNQRKSQHGTFKMMRILVRNPTAHSLIRYVAVI